MPFGKMDGSWESGYYGVGPAPWDSAISIDEYTRRMATHLGEVYSPGRTGPGGAPSLTTEIPLPDIPEYNLRVAVRPSELAESPSRFLTPVAVVPPPNAPVNPDRAMAAAALGTVGLGTIAKSLALFLAGNAIEAQFSQHENQPLVGGNTMSVHPTIIAMRLVGRSFAFSGDEIQLSDFTLGGQSGGRRVLERIKSVLTLGQQVPEYLEGLGLNDNAAELVEALLVDFDAMLADGSILTPEPRRGGETRSALYEQLNFLHFNLNNGNAWLTDNPYGNRGGGSRRSRSGGRTYLASSRNPQFVRMG